ncbi:YggS family pyridoxal phosphate-dependent enzyme [Candidatus Synechococcus spongiarum]|nr:YggS family pyridoxal phosphate-dependent enzyme [Candidatus Synechococcus spongiarum]
MAWSREIMGHLTVASYLEALRHRLPPGVTLLAVSKGQPAEAVEQVYAAGQRCFGESRLQEAAPKITALRQRCPQLEWHFIGQLQANKVRAVAKAFAWIHSLDRLSLAQRLDRIAGEEGCCPQVLLQVKLRPDPGKVGFSAEQLTSHVPTLVRLSHLKLRGLMTMAPLGLDSDQLHRLFSECRHLSCQLRACLPPAVARDFNQLSMGMSRDWPQAIAAGSTLVRIGSGIFGARLVSPVG